MSNTEYADPAMIGTSGYARITNDFYPTPPWVTEVLLRHVQFSPSVWEPACGDGAISKVLLREGYRVRSTDLNSYGYGTTDVDFLEQTDDCQTDIVTNPPYGDIAEDFVRHALNITKAHERKFALLMRNEWDSALTRSELYKFPYACKIILTRRPRWIEGSKGAPRHNYAWFIWDWAHQGRPNLIHDS